MLSLFPVSTALIMAMVTIVPISATLTFPLVMIPILVAKGFFMKVLRIGVWSSGPVPDGTLRCPVVHSFAIFHLMLFKMAVGRIPAIIGHQYFIPAVQIIITVP